VWARMHRLNFYIQRVIPYCSVRQLTKLRIIDVETAVRLGVIDPAPWISPLSFILAGGIYPNKR